jgi:pentatricopeptide repeat protein
MVRLMEADGDWPPTPEIEAIVAGDFRDMRPVRQHGVQDRMAKEGISPNQITYSSVINACASASPARPDEAMLVLDRMVKEGISPDQITYSSVLKACASSTPSSRLDIALKLAMDMDRVGVAVNHYTLPALLKCCTYCSPRQPEQAEDLFCRYIPSGHVHLNEHVEKALCKAVNADTANRLLRWARTTYPQCTRPPQRKGKVRPGGRQQQRGATASGPGGPARRRTNERRVDPSDGRSYSLDDFIEYYGGSWHNPPPEWSHAPRR